MVGVGSVFSSFVQWTATLNSGAGATAVSSSAATAAGAKNAASVQAGVAQSRIWSQSAIAPSAVAQSGGADGGSSTGSAGAHSSRQAERSWRSFAANRSGDATSGQGNGSPGSAPQQNNRVTLDFTQPLGSFIAQLWGQQSATAAASQNFRVSSTAAASYQAADQLGVANVQQTNTDLNIPGLPPMMSSGRRLDLSV